MDAAAQFYQIFLPALVFPFQLIYGLVTSNPLIGVLLLFGILASKR